MKVYSVSLFLLIVLPLVGHLLECQGNVNVTNISIDRFFYCNSNSNNNNNYGRIFNQIAERHYAQISYSTLESKHKRKRKRRKCCSEDCKDSSNHSNSDFKRHKDSKDSKDRFDNDNDNAGKNFIDENSKRHKDCCKDIGSVEILPLRVERGSAVQNLPNLAKSPKVNPSNSGSNFKY